MRAFFTLLSLLPFSVFAAEGASAPVGPSPWGQGILLGSFVVVFYLLIWRPQSKRAKEHRDLLKNLGQGDEVVTSGGLCGKIVKLSDLFVTIEVNNGIEIPFQKHTITQVLPKGTLKGL